MNSQKLIIASLIIGSSVLFASVFSDQPSAAEQSYVLLRNGNVLKGIVRSDRDRIAIAADGNSNLFVEPKQVAFIGPTLESLYQHQRSGVKTWGTGEHWQLSHWCIQQGLLDRAIQHYEVLEESAVDSPQFKQLEHLLRQALLADENVKHAVQKQATSEESDPQNESPVSRASAASPRLKSEPKGTKEASGEGWSTHEIPGYIRKTFHTSILPILVARCGQSGCHGILGKSDFHIYPAEGDQSASILVRDLDSVLKYIDRDRIQNSELLAYATKAHGIQRNPSLNHAKEEERALIERINFWVKSLALSQKPATSMPAQFPPNPTLSANPSSVSTAVANVPVTKPSTRKSLMKEEVEQDRNAKLSKPAKSAPPTDFLSMSELAELEAAIEKFEKQTGTGSNGTRATKKDPFNPEDFNRKVR